MRQVLPADFLDSGSADLDLSPMASPILHTGPIPFDISSIARILMILAGLPTSTETGRQNCASFRPAWQQIPPELQIKENRHGGAICQAGVLR
jgi:hypothetical protein